MLGSVDSLQNEIQRRHADAESKHKLAERLMQSAEAHEKAGNESLAKTDRDSAERYLRDAEESDRQAGIYEAEALIRMQRAANIDKEIEKLEHDYKAQHAALEDKKKSILG